MKITCAQFEGLISFYLNNELSDNLKAAFEEHLDSCPSCHIRYNMLSSIINELKEAYNQIITEENIEDIPCVEVSDDEEDAEDIQSSELSAYIDNELNDEFSIKMRRNIIAKPKLRKKLERLYNLRKIMSGSFDEQKSKLRTDYSKAILRELDVNTSNGNVYLHCFAFIMFVIGIIFISSIIIANII